MALFVPLDVEYATDAKIMETGDPLAELVYVRALCFAKKNPTLNGEFSRAQLVAFTHGISSPTKRADKLATTGAFTATERGWRITAWLKRNRSGEDIAAAAELASALGIEGNHRRWHVGPDGKPSVKCPLCIGIHRTGKASGTPMGSGSGNPNRGVSPEEEVEEEVKPEPEPEVEPEPEEEGNRSSSVSSFQGSAPATTTDSRIIDAIARYASLASAGRLNPNAYARTVRINTLAERGEQLATHLAAHPTATVTELVDVILGTFSPKAPAVHYDPDCPHCEGNGIANFAPEGQPGSYGPCPCRRTDPYPTTLATVTQLHQETRPA